MSQVNININVVTKAAEESVKKFSNTATASLQRVGKSQETIRSNYFQVAAAAGVASAALVSAFGLSVKKAAEFETGLLGVAKTVKGLTDKEIKELGDEIISLSKKTPFATNELLDLAKVAGQLGVTGKDNLLLFSKSIAVLGTAANISGEEAASSLARIITLTGDSFENIENITSSLVGLGNTFNANEGEIVQAALGISQATAQFTVSSDQVLGFATAVKSLGIQSELARSTFLQSFIKIRAAIDEGGASFVRLQELTGLTGDALKDEFDTNAGEVFRKFIVGLNKTGNATKELEKIGLSGIRINAVLPVLSKNIGTVNKALSQGSKDYKENVAAQEEFDKQANSIANRTKKFNNVLTETFRIIGSKLEPAFSLLINTATKFLETFNNLNGTVKTIIVSLGVTAAAVATLTTAIFTAKALIITFNLVTGTTAGSIFTLGAKSAASSTSMLLLGGSAKAAAGGFSLTAIAAKVAGVAMNFAFLGIPVLIAAIVGGIILLVKNFDAVAKVVSSVARTIGEFFGIIDESKAVFPDLIDDVGEATEKVKELGDESNKAGGEVKTLNELEKETQKTNGIFGQSVKDLAANFKTLAENTVSATKEISEFAKAQNESFDVRSFNRRAAADEKAAANTKKLIDKKKADELELKEFIKNNDKEILDAKTAATIAEIDAELSKNNRKLESFTETETRRLEVLTEKLGEEAAIKQFARELEAEERRADLEQQKADAKGNAELVKEIEEDLAELDKKRLIGKEKIRKAAAEREKKIACGITDNEKKKRKETEDFAKESFQNLQKLTGSNVKELFAIGKAAATAQAVINGISAVQMALTSAPFPFNVINAAVVGALAAANVAKIQSQKAPSFEQGGIVPGNSFSGDNVTANVNSGEMILNRQQQSRLFNMADGEGGGGRSQEIVINNKVELDGEIVFDSVSRQVADGRELGEVV